MCVTALVPVPVQLSHLCATFKINYHTSLTMSSAIRLPHVTFVYVCTCVCTCMYVRVCTCMYVRVYEHVYVCMYVCTCVCTCVLCMYICVYVCVYMCILKRVYTFTATRDKKAEDESDTSTDEPLDLKSMMIARAQEFEQLADMCLHSKKYVIFSIFSAFTLKST